MSSAAIDRRSKIGSEQVRALYDNAAVGVAGALVASAILAGVLLYLSAIPRQRVLIWFVATVASGLFQLALTSLYWRRKPPPSQWRLWASMFTAASIIEGARWGLGTIYLAAPGRLDEQLWLMMVMSSAAAASVSSIGAYLPAFYGLLFSAMGPAALWSLAQYEVLHEALALLATVFVAAVALLAWRTNRHFVEALNLRFENVDLARDLGVQKERAEKANLDKSYFLAAASHDLRQPVHALSLLVGALRATKLPEQAHRLVEQIELSTGALDALFGALLDISRLDAGVVEVDRRAFPIASLLDQVCRDFAAEADAKGIELGWRPCVRTVSSDPVLLERVLRNLISNAVRYTDRGRVLVGCRVRSAGLSIQVWDTGRGIAPDQQQKVFDEYYQVGNSERDRSRGLGLGLAIVRRSAALLESELHLCSHLGRGSRFEIVVPLAPPSAQTVEGTHQDAVRTAIAGLIVVIDDELAVREAMAALLEGWGHEVICASSTVEAIEKLAFVPKRPDMLICDFRLRDGESGITAVEQLRAEYRADIPAMLITGDTGPARISEASKSDLLLLHKPVSSYKLRAAISRLMR